MYVVHHHAHHSIFAVLLAFVFVLALILIVLAFIGDMFDRRPGVYVAPSVSAAPGGIGGYYAPGRSYVAAAPIVPAYGAYGAYGAADAAIGLAAGVVLGEAIAESVCDGVGYDDDVCDDGGDDAGSDFGDYGG